MYPSALLLLLALPPIDGPVLDVCAIEAADASTTLGVKDSVTLTGESLGSSGYARSGCKRFIADFVVHPGAHAASPSMERSFRVDGGSVWTVDGASKDLCEQYSLAVKVYRRKAGATAFETVASAKYQGRWIEPTPNAFGGGCNLTKTGTSAPLAKPNKLGPETWRVTVEAKLQILPLTVSATLAFQPKPPQ